MKTILLAAFGAALWAGAACAQDASVTADPNGRLHGSAPGVTVEAGGGQVRSSLHSPDASAQARTQRPGCGRGVTVRSADGAAVSSAWASGPGPTTAAGAGSPGSTVQTLPCADDRPVIRATPKRRHK
ncbi:hypothetical protein [Phenylobacterium sp.]|jgi:hypothetical protein|uniref:hypothetical protein n=1 Tax=Phenylobacterium sp. TaxID=1871053 RepID=UPI002F4160E9